MGMRSWFALFWVWLPLVAVGCGGAGVPGTYGGSSGDRDVAELPYPESPAPLAPVDVAAWNAKTVVRDGPTVVHTDPGDLPRLQLATDGGARLPLEHTHVKAKLTGFIAEVEVAQTYTNPHADPIEAVYTFPLPENSAVNHMRMQVGDRVIEAKIEERRRAKQIYESAKREGYTAALLEQERPNIFTQSVANIEPGKKIDIVIRYVQDLTYDAGMYEFVFPMVVGPRFMPGAPLEGPQAGKGTHRDTDRVPDASRISPPYLGKGDRSGHDISLELVADASLAVSEFEVPTHEVSARKPADGTLRLTLAERDSIPNRDFVLRYRVAGEKPRATLYVGDEHSSKGYFSLVVHPPQLDVDSLVGQREVIFVVDVSGSMSGTPLGMCKVAMTEALRGLRPVDTFNIITFAGATQKAFDAPRPANATNVREALAVVDGLSAGGGTHMANAVEAALSHDVARGRHRYVFFMTDGYVGNEDEIIGASASFVEALEARQQRARVFGFGVGSSVNRYLLEGLSRAGKGLAVFATTREDPSRAVNRFYHYIDRAVLSDVRVEWGNLGAAEVFPEELPDLFASHPIIVHGKYRGTPGGPLTVTAKVGARDVEIPVSVRQAKVDGQASEVLGALWARSKVASLEEQLWEGSSQGVQNEITRLGIDFHLVTRFTSFVAVDTSRKVGDGDPTTVVQPVESPEGVDVAMAGGVYRRQVQAGQAAPTSEPAMDEASIDDFRACGCRVAGDGSRRWPLPASLLIVALLLRRSRRRHG